MPRNGHLAGLSVTKSTVADAGAVAFATLNVLAGRCRDEQWPTPGPAGSASRSGEHDRSEFDDVVECCRFGQGFAADGGVRVGAGEDAFDRHLALLAVQSARYGVDDDEAVRHVPG